MPPVNRYGSSFSKRRNSRPLCSGMAASSGNSMAREHRRAPPAIGHGSLVDDAARARRHVAFLAARGPAGLLQRHSALTCRRHRGLLLMSHRARNVSVSSRVRWAERQINIVIVFISRIKYLYHLGVFRKGALMDIPQVEAFLAVGTYGGFRRAAEALRLTQPAVSARIRALEDSLSVRLFERGRQGHGLALSAAGRALRPHAEQLLHAAAIARQAVHDIR